MGLNRAASPETVALRRLLASLKSGESLTYAAISAAVGFDVTLHLGRLYRIRDQLKRSGSSVIEVVPRVGVRRLTDSEVVNEHAGSYVKRTARAAKRGSGGNASVQYEALDPIDQTRHNVMQAAFGAIGLLTKRRTQLAIADNGGARLTLPPTEVLGLFGKK